MNEASTTTSPDSLATIIKLVERCLLDIQPQNGRARVIEAKTALIEDIGLDSLTFVELTAALEEALQIDEFPMQDWVDEQRENGAPITVGTLAQACQRERARQLAKP